MSGAGEHFQACEINSHSSDPLILTLYYPLSFSALRLTLTDGQNRSSHSLFHYQILTANGSASIGLQ